jgi:hypothetical protein
MSPADLVQKDAAYRFLEALKATLNAELPPPDQIRSTVREIAAASKADKAKAHLRWPESAFLNHFVIPKIFYLIQTFEEIDEAQARRAFLCEGYGNMSQYCSGTPARTKGHPFTKIFKSTASEIVHKWKGGKGSPLTQASPDFAFRDPLPKVVFEGKYFEGGSADKASRELATDIYQAFFYRSLPYVAPAKSKAAWDYDFACLLAYDASPDGTLLAAWNELAEPVRAGFWEGANVYVMILRPGS